MADPDLNELRAIRRKAQAAIARANAALNDLARLEAKMETALDRMLRKAQGRDLEATPRTRAGDIRKQYCRAIRDAGGVPDGVWISFDQIAEGTPDVTVKQLRRSLEGAVELLVEYENGAYRLLENGLKLAELP